MTVSLTVNKSSQFFIAICKYQKHSYVTLGVSTENGHHFLAAFGKGRLDEESCSEIFSQADAYVGNENILLKKDDEGYLLSPRSNTVNYKAYGITYRQYLQYLDYMAALERRQIKRAVDFPDKDLNLYAYLPVGKSQTTIEFERRALATLRRPKKQSSVCPDDLNLSLVNNSCRHTAIRLVETARETAGLGEGVSSMFFKNLPLKAVFGGGQVKGGHHFYVLPLPPTAYKKSTGEHNKILRRLYKRLDRMVLIAQDDPDSVKKFEGIKTLYQQTAGRGPGDILEVIDAIELWEEEHLQLIETHRSWHFFSMPTATKSMFNKFHDQFDEIRESCSV